jgi:DNA-binding response OmpR family regulator
MLTGIGESLNETTSPLFGADEYIDKPFDFEKLDEKIVHVLEKRASQREAVPHPVGNGVGGPAKAAASARSKSKRPAKKAKPAKAAKAKPKHSSKHKKGSNIMAAKKGAKKGAKKAKKGAKKGKKK